MQYRSDFALRLFMRSHYLSPVMENIPSIESPWCTLMGLPWLQVVAQARNVEQSACHADLSVGDPRSVITAGNGPPTQRFYSQCTVV